MSNENKRKVDNAGPDNLNIVNLDKGDIILYHGGSEEVKYPEVRISKYTKDFSWGFYCTFLAGQAERWARRNLTPVVNKYKLLSLEGLSVKKFESTDMEWLQFVAECRSGQVHGYDVVEGPMADDTIYNYVDDYIKGNISAEAFFELAKFKYPTHQISFHTLKALSRLEFEGSYVADVRTRK